MKRHEIENTGSSFVSVHVGGKTVAFPPGHVKSVRDLFRTDSGQEDVEACKANESIQGHLASGKLKLTEKEVVQKVASGPGPLYNETDDEEERVRKILAWRQKLKGELAAPPRVQSQSQNNDRPYKPAKVTKEPESKE